MDRQPHGYIYPEPDLLENLVQLYFEKVHIVYPAVHRPTFLRELRKGTHLTDPRFGMLVLGVCGLASRYSDDPRVFNTPDDATTYDGSSAGWKYITQVPFWRNSMFDRTSPYDMQFFAVWPFLDCPRLRYSLYSRFYPCSSWGLQCPSSVGVPQAWAFG